MCEDGGAPRRYRLARRGETWLECGGDGGEGGELRVGWNEKEEKNNGPVFILAASVMVCSFFPPNPESRPFLFCALLFLKVRLSLGWNVLWRIARNGGLAFPLLLSLSPSLPLSHTLVF